MSSLYNFHKVSALLACSGQPAEHQLALIADEGYQVVINLGLTGTKYALNDEAASTGALGMSYCHIPVMFDNPQLNELAAFIRRMDEHAGEKVLVHCAANYRASVFTGLYLFSRSEITATEMQSFIEELWQPDGIWQQFITESMDSFKMA